MNLRTAGSKGQSSYIRVSEQGAPKKGMGKCAQQSMGFWGICDICLLAKSLEPLQRDPHQKPSTSLCWSGATLGPEIGGAEIGPAQASHERDGQEGRKMSLSVFSPGAGTGGCTSRRAG